MKVVWYRSALLASTMAIAYSCPVLPSFISLVTLLATGTSLTPQVVFTVISLMATVEITFADYCYRGVYYATQFAATLDKLESFLFQDNNRKSTSENSKAHLSESAGFYADVQPYVSLSKATSVVGQRETVLLDNVSVTFQGKEFIGIVGSIGSGKSSLLKVIVGELETREGRVFSSAKTVYVPQIAWLFSGTIRENIIFGERFDHRKFSEILEACALEEDLEMFPSGDLSFVGERGITLSGGQRARVALARAIYSNADIYLFDDPLSAVDAKVGAHIVNKCLRGLLRDKLIILVTHRLRYLQSTDRIFVMENGCITKETRYSELKSSLGKLLDDNLQEKLSAGSTTKEEVKESEPSQEYASKEAEKNTQEDRQYGGVSWRTYWRYLHAGNSVLFLVVVAVTVILPEGKRNGERY